MKLGVAQINPTLGDFEANAQLIRKAYKTLVSRGADLVICPEMSLCGYYPGDRLLYKTFINQQRELASEISAIVGPVPLVFGMVIENDFSMGPPLSNVAVWCEGGQIRAYCSKCLLPNYSVFDEQRHFSPGKAPLVIEYAGKRIALTICEDIWTETWIPDQRRYAFDPISYLSNQPLDLIVNISASPWEIGKLAVRQKLLQSVTKKVKAPMVYCNLVGAQDELIFDGQSIILDKHGALLEHLPAFQESFTLVNLNEHKPSSRTSMAAEGIPHIYKALVMGIRDYVHKSGFTDVVLGLSGGIDSAVVAVLAVDALGAAHVRGVGMPSAFSSDHSQEDAKALAQNLGIKKFEFISIESLMETATHTLTSPLGGAFEGLPHQNVQARLRGLILMALSNQNESLLLSTGNKSEMAMGYCTLYGDMCGSLAPIGDLYKTQVNLLAEYVNRDHERIPKRTLEKPPSAELSPGQLDSDSLPDYPTLDSILKLHIEQKQNASTIIAAGYDAEVVDSVLKKVRRSEHKRYQAPPILRVSSTAFGRGRRMPLAGH
jgi:NAD+ synthase (glutamine-hydrolysing)